MSDTPMTDESKFGTERVSVDFARRLERELNEANYRIKRLEEAGDRMRLYCADPDDCFAWDRAKETKL